MEQEKECKRRQVKDAQVHYILSHYKDWQRHAQLREDKLLELPFEADGAYIDLNGKFNTSFKLLTILSPLNVYRNLSEVCDFH